MSREPFDNASESRDSWLNDAFRQWDAGVPADKWEELDESLSIEKVSSRLSQSVAEHERAQDAWISESHNAWQPEMQSDGWARLNDSVSLEHVWKGLSSELNSPVSTRIPFIKLIAATVAMLFVAGKIADGPVYNSSPELQVQLGTIEGPADHAVTGTSVYPETTYTADNYKATVPAAPVSQQRNATADHVQRDLLTVNVPDQRQQHLKTDTEEPSANPEEQLSEETMTVVDPLAGKAMENPVNPLITENYGKRPVRFSPWTVQVGTQLSILQETGQSRFTSVLPKFGVAADVSFRHRIGRVELIHALGVSQYSQGAGKYVNGRYRTTEQHINTLQWSSSLGYNYGRFTAYGGVLFSKMLNGLEQNQSKVTKVYDFSAIEIGATAGIDCRVVTFPNSGRNISLGAQYQWIPNLQGKEQAFENIQGVRIQAKFSF